MLRTHVVKPKIEMIALLLVAVVNSPPFGLRSDHFQTICYSKGLLCLSKYYCQQMKLREGNAFSPVCQPVSHSVTEGGQGGRCTLPCTPDLCTGSWPLPIQGTSLPNMFKPVQLGAYCTAPLAPTHLNLFIMKHGLSESGPLEFN